MKFKFFQLKKNQQKKFLKNKNLQFLIQHYIQDKRINPFKN